MSAKSPMRKLSLAALPKATWKNGGGFTTDLVIAPPGAAWDDCLWRIGVAEIARSGAFSHLAGLDRLFVPLVPGLTLTVGTQAPRSLSAFEILAFSGDERTQCTVPEGQPPNRPALAFNLLWRRGKADGAVRCHPGAARFRPLQAGMRVLYIARGGFIYVDAVGRPLPLEAGDALVLEESGSAGAVEPSRPWSMLVEAEVRPVA
jgi:environmental stress-induced protein Ves